MKIFVTFFLLASSLALSQLPLYKDAPQPIEALIIPCLMPMNLLICS
jgi:hypothetical protein